MQIPENTPVIIGVGEASEALGDPGYRAMSHVDLAAEAARQALTDALSADVLAGSIDTIAAIRQFEISMPTARAPFGKADNLPRAIAGRIGADPRRAVLEVMGGQAPQHLVNEFCGAIARAEAAMVLIVGAEALSTVRALAGQEPKPDWSETVGGQIEDRGYGLDGLVSISEMRHGLMSAPALYGLLENARRGRLGLSKDAYRLEMAKLFAPFSEVAAEHPHAADRRRHTADEIATVTGSNRIVADPYPRLVVARDQVNQGAALLLSSAGRARELGIPESRWVFLHGYADVAEPPILERQDLSRSPGSVMAVRHALDCAGVDVGEISLFDLYSCFPIAVFNILDGLGLKPDDPRRFTVTGGLPYFGGPGNNYSTHAIVGMVRALRENRGSIGLVGANGGMLSKYSVGIYSCEPREWRSCESGVLQDEIQGWLPVPQKALADGPAIVETYTVVHGRDDSFAVIAARMEDGGARILARSAAGDAVTADVAIGEDIIGRRVLLHTTGDHNIFVFDRRRLAELVPPRPGEVRKRYDHIEVTRRGRVLEVVINRPEVRNALHPPAHEELNEVFDIFEADDQFWVAILTGKGDEAFSAGNDLKWGASGKPITLPRGGFGGLSTRTGRVKPIIAAVNGFAMGGGLEIALACDLVLIDATATFALPETKVGLVAAAGGLARLPRAIPPMVAKDMVLTGRRLTAAEAIAFGLASRMAPPGGALALAREVAEEILVGSPTSVRVSLEAMHEYGRAPTADDAALIMPRSLNTLVASEDMMEGMKAFAQKRRPVWTNR